MNKITTNDIIELLPIVAHKQWTVNMYDEIRDEDGRCPICSLIHEIDSDIDVYLTPSIAFEDLGLTMDESKLDNFMDAADTEYTSGVKKSIRNKMLKALGIE